MADSSDGGASSGNVMAFDADAKSFDLASAANALPTIGENNNRCALLYVCLGPSHCLLSGSRAKAMSAVQREQQEVSSPVSA